MHNIIKNRCDNIRKKRKVAFVKLKNKEKKKEKKNGMRKSATFIILAWN